MVSYPPSFQTFKWKIPIYIYECVACFKRSFLRNSLLQACNQRTGNSDNPVSPFPQQCNQLVQFASVTGCENCPSWFAAHRRGSSFAYQAHCPSPQQCLCTVSQNCSHPISFPHVASPSWVSLPLLVRNMRKN